MKLKMLPALLGLTMTIGGVAATWHYAGSDIPPIPLLDVLIGLSVFDYKPEDILPDEEKNEIGQNHLDLIEKISRGEIK